MSLLHAEPATTADLARQLRELRASPLARWLRPAAGPNQIDLGRAITERAVVLFRLGEASGTPGPEMLCRLIGQDLLAAGSALNRIGVDGDGLIWLAECGAMPRGPVIDMITHGAPAGLPVLATTTAAPVAADLTGLVNVVVAHRMEGGAVDGWLASLTGAEVAGPGQPAHEPNGAACPPRAVVRAGPG